MAESIKRSRIVCLRNKCNLCGLLIDEIPLSCEYDILHLLATERGEHKERRWGKTTELVKIANELCQSYPIYFVCRTHHMRQLLDGYGISKAVKVITFYQIMQGTGRGLAPGYILCDEIWEEELEIVEKEMVGSKIVAAYYTQR